MRKLAAITLTLALTLAAGYGVWADVAVAILVSPQTILLDTAQGGSVTVHAEIAYGLVDTSSLTLNGVPARCTFADSRGELVAKFPETAIKVLVAPPSAVLTLSGVTVDGDPFSGSEEVAVKDWAAAE